VSLLETNGQDLALEILMATTKLFESEDIRRAIVEQAIETFAFMLKNDGSHPSTDKDGLAPRVELPWWPIADKPVVYTIKEKIQREDHLRWRAFDHGIVNYMYGLARRRIIRKLSANDIDALLKGGTKAILYEVVETYPPRKTDRDHRERQRQAGCCSGWLCHSVGSSAAAGTFRYTRPRSG
jgi:hypothetical protein